jgi:hypothetical protein
METLALILGVLTIGVVVFVAFSGGKRHSEHHGSVR